MHDKISHKGVVMSASAERVEVRIVQSSACSACGMARHCNASETSVKMVEVRGCDRWQSLKPGDEVTVSASRQVAGIALLLGFGVPLAVMLAVIGAMWAAGFSETAAALAGIGSLTPYYILLYAMRKRIATKVEFEIG